MYSKPTANSKQPKIQQFGPKVIVFAVCCLLLVRFAIFRFRKFRPETKILTIFRCGRYATLGARPLTSELPTPRPLPGGPPPVRGWVGSYSLGTPVLETTPVPTWLRSISLSISPSNRPPPWRRWGRCEVSCTPVWRPVGAQAVRNEHRKAAKTCHKRNAGGTRIHTKTIKTKVFSAKWGGWAGSSWAREIQTWGPKSHFALANIRTEARLRHETGQACTAPGALHVHGKTRGRRAAQWREAQRKSIFLCLFLAY